MKEKYHIKCVMRDMDNLHKLSKVFLVCINSKCQSGKVVKIEEFGNGESIFYINLIEPSYFDIQINRGDKIEFKFGPKLVSNGSILDFKKR